MDVAAEVPPIVHADRHAALPPTAGQEALIRAQECLLELLHFRDAFPLLRQDVLGYSSSCRSLVVDQEGCDRSALIEAG